MIMASCITRRLPKSLILTNLKNDSFGCLVPTASFKLRMPPNYDNVVYPENRRLKIYHKVPAPVEMSSKPPKNEKMIILMRGPEEVHNKLQYGNFGLQAVTGGRLKYKQLDNIRSVVYKQMPEENMFAVWRVGPLWQSVTKKGVGKRMGGDKGSIDHYVFPFKAERIIVEFGGHCEFAEVFPLLVQISSHCRFRTRIVTHESMMERERKEKEVAAKNQNVFTFEYCAKNNILGCNKYLGPYDHIWHNKYR